MEATEAKQPWQMTREEYITPRRESANIYGDVSEPVMPKGSRALIGGKVLKLYSEKAHLGTRKKWKSNEIIPAETINTVQADSTEDFCADGTPETEYIKADAWHKGVVVLAVREGKPVPSEVLADYPDLVSVPI